MTQNLNLLATHAYSHHTSVSILLIKKILHYKQLLVGKKNLPELITENLHTYCCPPQQMLCPINRCHMFQLCWPSSCIKYMIFKTQSKMHVNRISEISEIVWVKLYVATKIQIFLYSNCDFLIFFLLLYVKAVKKFWKPFCNSSTLLPDVFCGHLNNNRSVVPPTVTFVLVFRQIVYYLCIYNCPRSTSGNEVLVLQYGFKQLFNSLYINNKWTK